MNTTATKIARHPEEWTEEAIAMRKARGKIANRGIPTLEDLADLIAINHPEQQPTVTSEMATLIDQCLELLRQFEAVRDANTSVGAELLKTVRDITGLLDLALSAPNDAVPDQGESTESKAPRVFKSLKDLARHIVAENRAEIAEFNAGERPVIQTGDKYEMPGRTIDMDDRAERDTARYRQWSSAMDAIRREARILEIAARDIANGTPRTQDIDRIRVAADRILETGVDLSPGAFNLVLKRTANEL